MEKQVSPLMKALVIGACVLILVTAPIVATRIQPSASDAPETSNVESIAHSHTPTQELSGLYQAYEATQVAIDLYSTLNERWGTRKHSKMVEAEQGNLDLIKKHIERLNGFIPERLPAGSYFHPDYRAAYSELSSLGMTSVEDSMKAGVRMEALQLETFKQKQLDSTDVELVRLYGDLITATERHSFGFERAGTGTGGWDGTGDGTGEGDGTGDGTGASAASGGAAGDSQVHNDPQGPPAGMEAVITEPAAQ